MQHFLGALDYTAQGIAVDYSVVSIISEQELSSEQGWRIYFIYYINKV